MAKHMNETLHQNQAETESRLIDTGWANHDIYIYSSTEEWQCLCKKTQEGKGRICMSSAQGQDHQ